MAIKKVKSIHQKNQRIKNLKDLEKNALKVFDFPMFDAKIYFFAKPKWGALYKDILELLELLPSSRYYDNENTCHGIAMCGALRDRTDIVVIVNDINDINTVAHEIHHAVSYLDKSLSDDLYEEALAYIMGYLMGGIYNNKPQEYKNGCINNNKT